MRARSSNRARYLTNEAVVELPYPAIGIDRLRGPRLEVAPGEDTRESRAPLAEVAVGEDTRESRGGGSEVAPREDTPAGVEAEAGGRPSDPSDEVVGQLKGGSKVEPSSEAEAFPDVETAEGGPPNAVAGSPSRRRGIFRRANREKPKPRPSRPPRKPAPTRVLRADGRGSPEWCTIVFARTERTGQFHVVVHEGHGRRRVVERSPTFRVPRSLRIRDRGEPRAAHALLVEKLLNSGWQPLEVRGRWHDTAFFRYPEKSQRQVKRLLVDCARDGDKARFYAGEFDTFGNGTPIAKSKLFPVELKGSLVCQTDEAIAAHEALIDELRSTGWTTTEVGSPEWYSRVLQRSGNPKAGLAGA